MKNSIGLGVFGTFGSPNGFQTLFYHDAQFAQTFDLSPTAIELDIGDEMFAVKKELNGGVYSVCFCIYTYAKEPQSSRKGTFFGSCIVFENSICQGADIYDCLYDFHRSNLENRNNIKDTVLQVQDINDLIVKEPARFETLIKKSNRLSNSYNVRTQDFVLIDGKDLPEIKTREAISFFFNEAVETFPEIGTLYLTKSSNVIEYVKSKGLISVESLKEFVDISKNSKTTEKTSKKHKEQISKKPQKIEIQETTRTWNTPKSQWSIQEVKKRVEEHNNLFHRYEDVSSKYENLKNSKVRSYRSSGVGFADARLPSAIRDFRENYKKISTIIIITIFTVILVSLLYVVWHFVYQQNSEEIPITYNNSRNSKVISVSGNLYPSPNGELNADDLKKINKQVQVGMTASDIADLAIKFSEDDIGRVYKNKKELYAEALIVLNSECFDGKTKNSKLRCEGLEHIPINKQSK